jgi:hypothetical protein
MQFELGDIKYQNFIIRYYRWMSSIGVCIFGVAFLIAQVWLTGCLILMVGISMMPYIKRKYPLLKQELMSICRLCIILLSIYIIV